jgi:hypothetical protein
MRQMSAERRRVVAMASSLAAMSGVGPVLLRGHPAAEWVWLAVYLPLMLWVIVRMVRLGRRERCGSVGDAGIEMTKSEF